VTIADELENRRRCCYGLAGVAVAVDDEPGAVAVSATRWGDGGVLELALADGRVVPAPRLSLRSPWPVVCCRPLTSNPWNQIRHDPPPKGVRPPP
jgi:hypothetical protein